MKQRERSVMYSGAVCVGQRTTYKSVERSTIFRKVEADVNRIARKPGPDHSSSERFARRAGGALGLAYAMHDAGAAWTKVRNQLREARSFECLMKETE